jgi:hypothetical protein
MNLGNNKDMGRGLGVDIPEGHTIIVLMNPVSPLLPCYNLTE